MKIKYSAAEVRRQARLEEYVAKVVATAPPLTDEQRIRIASLLRRSSGVIANERD